MDVFFLYVELLSLLVALWQFPRLRSSHLVWFIPFLALTNLQEWGSHFGLTGDDGDNSVSLNIFTTVEFMFYSWFFYRAVDSAAIKRYIKIAAPILLILICLNVIFGQGLYKFTSYTFELGSLFMISIACLAIFRLYRQENEVRLLSLPLFWISIGITFYYGGMFFFYAFFPLLVKESSPAVVDLFIALVNVFNTVLYSCYIVAFLCQKNWQVIYKS